jgi:exodeoxyribonuclease VII small subunit
VGSAAPEPLDPPEAARHKRRMTEPGISDLSFEDALKRLEAIVQQLESGDVPLEKSIELYSEGDKLRAQCEQRLKAAQAKIERIQVGADGQAADVRSFDAG